MTRDEILKMPAGREMDALVAEKAMEWTLKPHEIKDEPYHPLKFIGFTENGAHVSGLPCFSTDIVSAWKVANKFGFVIGPEWSGGFDSVRIGWAVYKDWLNAAQDTASEDSDALALAIAKTAPLAISRAALIITMGAC